ncbi:MAG TPA: hypothetical protein VLV31_05175 [Candidatus Acidoferrales bacterium]|nr:hypothetical protein [Candidatus Acidoferrales bacterium]
MKTIVRHSDIYNPDAVKACLAQLNVTEARKEALVICLSRSYRWKQIQWALSRYRRIDNNQIRSA